MKIIQVDLNKDYSEVIREAVMVLNYGGVIVYPTDTLYGLGANALNEIAVRKIFKIKERSLSRPLPIIVKNLIWAKELAHINPRNEGVLQKVWPGKTTVILPKKDLIPDITTAGQKTVGIRIANYAFLDVLLGKFGYPLSSTSANISGDDGTGEIDNIIKVFSKSEFKPDLIIDVGILPKSEPSTVLDLTTAKPKILRIGPSKPHELMKFLEI